LKFQHEAFIAAHAFFHFFLSKSALPFRQKKSNLSRLTETNVAISIALAERFDANFLCRMALFLWIEDERHSSSSQMQKIVRQKIRPRLLVPEMRRLN